MKFWEAAKLFQEGKQIKICVNDGLSEETKETLENFCEQEWELYEGPAKMLSFQEAIAGMKEGKGFRRKSHPKHRYEYLQIQTEQQYIFVYPGGYAWLCKPEDFEATDWEEVK